MNKKVSSIIAASVLAMGVGFGACAGNTDDPVNPGGGSGERPLGKTISIYTGGSSEFTWTAGSEEERVLDYVEQKYYDETGVSLDFQISHLGENMRSKLGTALSSGGVDVIVSHTRGGVGVDDYLIEQNAYFNINTRLRTRAKNLLKYIEGDPLWSMTTSNNEVVGIPSAINPYKFGILVRKDRMEKAGYTDDAAKTSEICPATNKNYILVDNLEDFADMCVAMNALEGAGAYAVSGAVWDVEKALTLGAFADSGYFTSTLKKGSELGLSDAENANKDLVVTGYGTKEYEAVTQIEYEWVQKGILNPKMNGVLLEEAETEFIAGKTSVFVEDPTVQHLIQVARKTKAEDSSAEFTVLPALRAYRDESKCPQETRKDKNGNEITRAKKGFMRNTSAVFAACFSKNSKNVDDVLKFLNWVFENENNYNLCRYGIEGEHWVNNGDGTYSYPEGKESYLTNPPYSGILTLVENQNISNLTYTGYTADELHWINDVAGDADNYVQNEVIDYLFVLKDDAKAQSNTAGSNMYAHLVQAWNGTKSPDTFFETDRMGYLSASSAVRKQMTDQYLLIKQRKEKAQQKTNG